MKKQFEERGRLTVYLENSDLRRMMEKARSEGKLLAEWAREALLGKIRRIDAEAVREPEPLPVAERGVAAPERPAEPAEADSGKKPGRAVCAHGTAKGYHCWRCQGMAVIEKNHEA